MTEALFYFAGYLIYLGLWVLGIGAFCALIAVLAECAGRVM